MHGRRYAELQLPHEDRYGEYFLTTAVERKRAAATAGGEEVRDGAGLNGFFVVRVSNGDPEKSVTVTALKLEEGAVCSHARIEWLEGEEWAAAARRDAAGAGTGAAHSCSCGLWFEWADETFVGVDVETLMQRTLLRDGFGAVLPCMAPSSSDAEEGSEEARPLS